MAFFLITLKYVQKNQSEVRKLFRSKTFLFLVLENTLINNIFLLNLLCCKPRKNNNLQKVWVILGFEHFQLVPPGMCCDYWSKTRSHSKTDIFYLADFDRNNFNGRNHKSLTNLPSFYSKKCFVVEQIVSFNCSVQSYAWNALKRLPNWF